MSESNFKPEKGINRREFLTGAAALAGIAALPQHAEADQEINPDAEINPDTEYDADAGSTYEAFLEQFNKEFSQLNGYSVIEPVIRVSGDGLSLLFKVQMTPMDEPQQFEVSLIDSVEYDASEKHSITYAQFSQKVQDFLKTAPFENDIFKPANL